MLIFAMFQTENLRTNQIHQFDTMQNQYYTKSAAYKEMYNEQLPNRLETLAENANKTALIVEQNNQLNSTGLLST